MFVYKSTLNIIIPAYNEESYIFEVLKEIDMLKLDSIDKLKVIVIDDCSTDKTAKEVERAKKELIEMNIHLIRNKKNYGKGYCLRKGFELTERGIIIIQDADLEYSPTEYFKLINPLLKNKADVVYGSRFQGSEPKRVLYFSHFIANKFVTTLSNILTGLNLSDMETCYKAFNTDLLNKMHLKENRFGFEPEITAKLSRIKGIKFVEVGISYYGRTYGEGKKIGYKDAIRAIWCIFKYNIWSRK